MSEAVIPANTLPLTGIGLSRAGVDVHIGEIDGAGWLAEPAASIVPVLMFGRLPRDPMHDIEFVDAARAHGWQPDSHITAAWSFYPTKSFGAAGDSGAVTTNDSSLAQAMRDICGRDDVLRDRRQITARIDEIQAAVLRVKLRHLDSWLVQRGEVAAEYNTRRASLGITLAEPSLNPIFAIRVRNRAGLQAHLADQKIETKIHWSQSLDSLDGPWTALGDYPNAHTWASEILSLPMFPGLTHTEVERVCDVIESWCESNKKKSALQ